MSPIKRALLSLLLVGACVSGPGAIAYALWSAPATATIAVTVESPTTSAPAAPSAPSNFRCGTPEGNSYSVNWDTTTGATSYVLYRYVGTANTSTSATARPSGAPTAYATISPAPTVSPSAVVEVQNNRFTWYSVRAVNAGGGSGGSNEVRVRRDGATAPVCVSLAP